MKKTILPLILILCIFTELRAQQLPDTAHTIKTTNNQLYQLNALFTVADQNLLKSMMPVAQYVEWQKQYQALLVAWFSQKQKEDEAGKKEKKP